MRLTISQRIARWGIRRVLRSNAPDTIPRTGDKGRAVNCYYVILTKLGETQPWVLVDSTNADHLDCLEWDGDKFDKQVKMLWTDFQWNQVKITHYFGLNEFAYGNFGDYLRVGLTQYYRFLIWADISRQYLYNSQRISRQDRTQILQYLVERHTENSADSCSAFGVASELHSNRIWQHPDGNRIR